MRRIALLAVAAVAYTIAAWMVAPGFYDGFGPPQPYNFTCPPPQAGSNQKPSSGHADFNVIGGISDAGSAFTQDGQIVIGVLPGALLAKGASKVTIDIRPLATCPSPSGIRLVTNVYEVTSTSSLDPTKSANVDMAYSNLMPNPSAIYVAANPNGPWTALTSQPGAPYTIAARTTTFGYFAAGYPSSSPPPGSVTVGGGHILPIVVAILIVVVVLAGLPLAVMRRRGKR